MSKTPLKARIAALRMSAHLFDFLMNGMFVAETAVFFQFHPSRRVATVFLRRVSRHPRRSLRRIRPTFGTF